ncbi:ARS binding protein 2-domain-containing protein [Durotheca rogersii]|uniref:ARS binding protein 2-domain-containing protein n=1 Tax=Durotheca rogersii TaxID=419775 RepID=UPI00221F27C7|nr:ARS binding protein 2-domain-containing protein [Durotheca rogersii]KAI5862269.1 ARS binding protein 2-domain-containing protein [Durotheca rogersii]
MALSTPTSSASRRFNPLSSPSKNDTPQPVVLVRPILPQKAVTDASIEEAYVNFILYCNPAVPLETDTAALREAFRTPPRSEGKSFSTFALFELIKQLHAKELKTWADLALKLGVEPPDHDKGQSSQKIQQYAVRLKRWMHSMHIDAFFDYLMDNPHTYWTHIPTDPNPVCEDGRDGVAAQDDMALRALLPHIRPRRGRKRPEEDGFSKSPSQRPRLGSPSFNRPRPDSLDPWTAHPDGRSAFMFPQSDPRSSLLPEAASAFPWNHDASREPMSAYPQSAMTPSTRGTFWGDPSEPRSAVSPPKVKSLGRRHGAKVVSSAWRSSGAFTTGRPRGRPPTSRPNESSLSAVLDGPAPPLEPTTTPQSATPTSSPMPPPDPTPSSAGPTSTPTTRPTRPGRLSLQVPERASAPVRLATPPPPLPPPPPPAVMVNGKAAINGDPGVATTPTTNGTNGVATPNHGSTRFAGDAFTVFDRTSALFTAVPADGGANGSSAMLRFDPQRGGGDDDDDDGIGFGAGGDRTNCEEIEALFVADLLEGSWLDADMQPGPPGTIDEALALVRAVIASISRQALTKEAFLINLSALAGVKYMMRRGSSWVQRIEVGPDRTRYQCSWGLRYGAVSGTFRLTETVAHARWKGAPGGGGAGGAGASVVDVPPCGDAAAEFWRARYAGLARAVNRRGWDADGDMHEEPGNGGGNGTGSGAAVRDGPKGT